MSRIRVVSFESTGLVLRKGRRTQVTVPYQEILTAERRGAPRRGIRLHVREGNAIDVSCGRSRLGVEGELRWRGVRVVDCWGCIIAPTLLDFEDELAKEPVRMRQSYDNA